MSRKREVSSGKSFFPTPFPLICGKTSAKPEKSCRGGGYVISKLLLSLRTNRAQQVALHCQQGRRAGWWEEGREGRGRQGNQGLNLDTNLNRYCPSQSSGLMRQAAANSVAAPILGDTTCALSPFLSLLYIFCHLTFASPHTLFCLYFFPLLAVTAPVFLPVISLLTMRLSPSLQGLFLFVYL